MLVHGDGDEEMLVLPRGSSYLAIVVFAAAFDPLSTMELADFSSAVGDFNALDCELVGLSRDSHVAIKEWMLEVGECQFNQRISALHFLPIFLSGGGLLSASGLCPGVGIWRPCAKPWGSPCQWLPHPCHHRH